MIDYDYLVGLFTLDWDGWLYNRYSRGRAKEGERAGSPTGHGYRRVIIDGKKYYEHHLVWFYVHGEWPDEIDHIDGDRSNNAPANLRLCDRTLNNCNRTQRPTGESGLRGAYLDKRTQRWYSHIQFGGRVIYLGMFDTAMEAHLAFEAAAERLHGEFYLPKLNSIKDHAPWRPLEVQP